MRYKARRRQEVKARNERPPERRMSEPPPIEQLSKATVQPERVPIRTGPNTIRHFRVSQLEGDLEGWARYVNLTVAELVEVIRVRRYTPAPPPVAKEPRSPSWYLSDNHSGNYRGYDF